MTDSSIPLPGPLPVPARPRVRGTSHGFDLAGESTPLRQLVADLWGARPLIAMLARKDFLVRYRRAAFGLLWAVGLPLFQASVLALVFTHVVRVKTTAPYAVFVFAAFVPWTFVSGTLGVAATSIVDNAGLASKIYFPRAVLPIAAVWSNLYGSAVTVVALFLMSLGFGVVPGVRILLLVPAMIATVVFAMSICLLLSALHVYFRDTRYLVQASLTVWLYVTPVFYPLSLTSGVLRAVILANPLTGVVELFRAAIVGGDPGWAITLLPMTGWIVVFLLVAVRLHLRYNRVFSDLL